MMMQSFQRILEDSDADISDLDDDKLQATEAAVRETYSNPRSGDSSESSSPQRSRARRTKSYQGSAGDRSPVTSLGDAHDAFDIEDPPQPRRLSRRSTVLEEVEPGPICFETELYEYSRAPDNDFDEPIVVGVTIAPAPVKISKLGIQRQGSHFQSCFYVFRSKTGAGARGRRQYHRASTRVPLQREGLSIWQRRGKVYISERMPGATNLGHCEYRKLCGDPFGSYHACYSSLRQSVPGNI